jgi:hypothetical protein
MAKSNVSVTRRAIMIIRGEWYCVGKPYLDMMMTINENGVTIPVIAGYNNPVVLCRKVE